ncbi:MAG TPA: EAL domain-containing protein [Usitatibacter sp.]|nr:EAL domain-containing protein [Usitatibacter sp.]
MTALTTLLKHLGRDHFPGSRFSEPRAGRAVADDALGRFTSAFQPIVEASHDAVAGHHAFLRAADGRGRALAPGELFASIRDDESLERLDRLARALHMVNYFPALNDHSRLFVTVDARLIAAAPDEHRGCFDALLTSLDVPTSRVVVSLPASALDDPVTFVRSTLSYGIRGYRVLATLRLDDAHADLDHVFLADPHYVAIDASSFPAPGDEGHGRDRLRRIVQSLHGRGIRTLARRVETAEQAAFARDAGFTLLQGQYVAPPATDAPAFPASASSTKSPRKARSAVA